MKMKKIEVEIEGISPMIQHNGQTADPLNHFSKEMKKISGKRKKTEDDYARLAELEWEASLYWDDDLGVYVPSDNIQAMLYRAAKKFKLGTSMYACIVDDPNGFPVITKHHDNLMKLRESKENKFAKAVVVNRARIVRMRSIFRDWSLKFRVMIDPTVIDFHQFEQIAEAAGKAVGLGDWRPGSPTPGHYGRFTVKKLEEVDG